MKETLGFYRFVKRMIREIGEDDVSGAAAELSYRFFLALFPFAIFLASLGSFVADLANMQNPTDQIMDAIGDQLPADTASLLREQIDQVVSSKNAGLLSIGIVATIWAASSGVGTIMKSMNKAYRVKETRRFWTRYTISLGLTGLGGISLIFAFVITVVGQIYGMQLSDELGFGGAARWLFPLLRLPLAMLFIMMALSILYWIAPDAHLPFTFFTPGAMLFTLSWVIVSYIFGLYVSHFGDYNATYGTLGALVVLMIWFYITAFILLVGAVMNAVLARESAPGDKTKSTVPAPHTTTTESKDGKDPKQRSNVGVVLAMVGTAAGLASLARRRGSKSKSEPVG